MTEYTLPYFGAINIESLAEYYEVDVEVNEKLVQIDLNFEANTLSLENFERVKSFIENIEKFDQNSHAYIQQNFEGEQDGTVKEYVYFHLDELGDDFLAHIGISNSIDKAQQFLNKLYLTRIGLYPDGKYDTSYFAVFDYTTNQELSDQLLVVKTDHQGRLDHLSWES
jgi:hypothetical protein